MKKKLGLKKETVLALNGYKGGIRETMISQCMADHTQVDCAMDNTELCSAQATACNCPMSVTGCGSVACITKVANQCRTFVQCGTLDQRTCGGRQSCVICTETCNGCIAG